MPNSQTEAYKLPSVWYVGLPKITTVKYAPLMYRQIILTIVFLNKTVILIFIDKI